MEKEERLHSEVGFPSSIACGEDSCSSDLLGKQKGRREAGQGRRQKLAGMRSHPETPLSLIPRWAQEHERHHNNLEAKGLALCNPIVHQSLAKL